MPAEIIHIFIVFEYHHRSKYSTLLVRYISHNLCDVYYLGR